MSTQISVSVALEGLRKLSQAQVNANRQAKLLEDQRLKLAQQSVGKQQETRAAEGRDLRGQLLYGIKSDRQRPREEPFAVFRTAAGGMEFGVGWIVRQDADTVQIVSSDGSTGLAFTTLDTNIGAASAAPSPFSTALTFDPTTNFGWNAWAHRTTALEITPSSTDVWYRFRPCNQVDLAIVPEVASYGRTASIVMPLANNLIYARVADADWYRRDYLLTASTSVDYATTSPFAGMIWTYEEVAGSAVEDPDTLLADPTRTKIMRINIDAAITVSDDQETNVSYNLFKCYSISRTSVREVSTPTGLSDKVDEMYGTIPTPANQTGINASTGGPTVLPGVASTVIDGTTWTSVRPYSITSFTGYTRKNPGLSYGRVAGLQELYENTPAAAFGIGRIRTDDAEMRSATDNIGTPFVYRILDGSATYTESDFYGSLQALEDCLTGLAPLPSQFLWINRRPNDGTAGFAYQDTERPVSFITYLSSLDNARTGGDWFDFGGDGLPSTPGVPPALAFTLVPLEDRVAPGEDYLFDTLLLLAAPYGDGAACRTKLLELGFTTADLTP